MADTTTWIALLRGINVGGHNILPMADLQTLLAGLGYSDVKTYIQSGNAVFTSIEQDAAIISNAITHAISAKFGFAPSVLMLRAEALEAALNDNPYKDAEHAVKTVHLFFVSDMNATVNAALIDEFKAESEAITAAPGVLYLHAPDGVGRSKLMAKIDSCVSAPITARNLNSATKILALAKG